MSIDGSFRSAFSGEGFGSARPSWVEITGDGEKHFINDGGDRPEFIFGPGGGISKLTPVPAGEGRANALKETLNSWAATDLNGPLLWLQSSPGSQLTD